MYVCVGVFFLKTHSIVPLYRFALISIRYIVYFSINQMNMDALDLESLEIKS